MLQNPRSPLKRLPFGMRGLSASILEAFYHRGLLKDVTAQVGDGSGGASASAAAHWMQQPRRPAGHFAVILFYEDNIDASKWPFRLPSPAGTSMAVDRESLEATLVLPGGITVPGAVAMKSIPPITDQLSTW
jgi:hypothetical protein